MQDEADVKSASDLVRCHIVLFKVSETQVRDCGLMPNASQRMRKNGKLNDAIEPVLLITYPVRNLTNCRINQSPGKVIHAEQSVVVRGVKRHAKGRHLRLHGHRYLRESETTQLVVK